MAPGEEALTSAPPEQPAGPLFERYADRYTITGEIAQAVRVVLGPGEEIWASKGSLISFSPALEWRLRVPGGVEGAVRRSFSGEGISLTHVSAGQEGEEAVFASSMPGHVTVWDLSWGPVITTRGSFLAAWGPVIDIDVTVARSAGAALFGGAGFFLQRIEGEGLVFIHGSGDFLRHDLGEGEVLMVSTGSLAAFSTEVGYEIERVRGFRRMFFGGEGLFLARMRGPGTVYVQTLSRRG